MRVYVCMCVCVCVCVPSITQYAAQLYGVLRHVTAAGHAVQVVWVPVDTAKQVSERRT